MRTVRQPDAQTARGLICIDLAPPYEIPIPPPFPPSPNGMRGPKTARFVRFGIGAATSS
jgi:hypothetical protein